ncbi:transposase [Aquimarina sp. 2201CG1-2-11]
MCDIYKRRWQIETMFKRFKQKIHIKIVSWKKSKRY